MGTRLPHSTARSTACSSEQERNIKAVHYWPFVWENPPVTGGFPLQRASNAESFSMSWRHQHGRVLVFNLLTWWIDSIEDNYVFTIFVFLSHIIPVYLYNLSCWNLLCVAKNVHRCSDKDLSYWCKFALLHHKGHRLDIYLTPCPLEDISKSLKFWSQMIFMPPYLSHIL